MSAQDQWFPLHCGDYLRDTGRLTAQQHGAYLLLLIDYWTNGPLPDSIDVMCLITREKPRVFRAKIWPVLSAFFVQEKNGFYHQKRMDHERERRGKIAESRRFAANTRHAKVEAGVRNVTTPHAKAHANGLQNPCKTRARARSTSTEDKKDSDLRSASASPIARLPPNRFSLFTEGVQLYRRLTGAAEGKARRRIGQLLRDAQDEVPRVMDALRDCPATLEPDAWLTEAVQARPFLNGFMEIIAEEGMPSQLRECDDPVSQFIEKYEKNGHTP